MRLSNAFPEARKDKSPVQLANPSCKAEDLSSLRTFGCQTWVKPPGARDAKLVPNSQKGIFLGYVPYTTRTILLYDVATHKVKIATHAKFDEGFNDFPMDQVPSNGQHLMRTDEGTPFPAETRELSSSDFGHFVTPIKDLQLVKLSFTACDKDDEFGFRFADDPVLSKPYITNIKDKTPESQLCSTYKAL